MTRGTAEKKKKNRQIGTNGPVVCYYYNIRLYGFVRVVVARTRLYGDRMPNDRVFSNFTKKKSNLLRRRCSGKSDLRVFRGGRAAEDIRGDDGTVAIILFAEKRDNSFSSSKPMTEYRNARRVSLWDPYRNRQTSFYKNVRSAEEICRELTKNRRGSEVSQITKRTVSRSSFLRKIQTVLEFSNTPPVSDIGPGF